MSSTAGAEGVLILEILDADRNSDIPGPHLAFLQAALRACGAKTRWVVLGVPTPDFPADGSAPVIYTLSSEEGATIDGALEEHDPALVLLTRRLEVDCFNSLRGRHPTREFALVTDPYHRKVMLETGGSRSLDALLSQLAPEEALHRRWPPDYQRTPLNAAAVETRPYTHLYLGSQCLYRKPIGNNRFYRGCDLETSFSTQGCTFCLPPYASFLDVAEAPVDRAIELLEAAAKTVPAAFQHQEYQVHGIQLWHQLDAFLPRLLSHELPPASFLFSARFDEILGAEPALDRHLPQLHEQGHRLLLGNVGLENFSDEENERFNKGLTAPLLDRGIALVRRLEEAYPETFLFSQLGGFGFIMFTPWTRLEDLETNLVAFRRNDLPMESLHFTSAVQLLPGRAITLLAEQEGLTADTFLDRRFDSGCMSRWDEHEIPWRFAHPEVQTVFSISRRIFLLEDDPEDPLTGEVVDWVLRMGGTGDDAARLFEALLLAAHSHPQAPPGEMMAEASKHLPDPPSASSPELSSPAEAEAPPAPTAPPKWRWLLEALNQALRKAPLPGLPLTSGEALETEEEWELQLTFGEKDRSLCIEVRRHREEAPAFLHRGAWAISYRDARGLSIPEITQACEQVLAATGRALASLRRDS